MTPGTGDATPGHELDELERLLVNLRPHPGKHWLSMTPAFRDALVRLVRAARVRQGEA